MSFKCAFRYITVSLLYGDIAHSKIKTEYSVPSLQNPWFWSLRISEGLKITVVSVQKGTAVEKGGYILLVDEVQIIFKNTDKSKSKKTIGVLSDFQQLPPSLIFHPLTTTQPFLVPEPGHSCPCIFCYSSSPLRTGSDPNLETR